MKRQASPQKFSRQQMAQLERLMAQASDADKIEVSRQRNMATVREQIAAELKAGPADPSDARSVRAHAAYIEHLDAQLARLAEHSPFVQEG